MPEKHLQIIDHPNGEVRVTPPDLHLNGKEKAATLHFNNHLGEAVTVTLNPLLSPNPPWLDIDPGASKSSNIEFTMGGTFPYQVYIGKGTGGPKAKGLCDPIIIVYPPGHY